jgi:hypothetical protein
MTVGSATKSATSEGLGASADEGGFSRLREEGQDHEGGGEEIGRGGGAQRAGPPAIDSPGGKEPRRAEGGAEHEQVHPDDALASVMLAGDPGAR